MRAFAGQADSAVGAVKLAIAGAARRRPLDGGDLISRAGRALFCPLVLRPRLLGRLRVELDPSDLGQLISFEEVFVEGAYDLSRVPFAPDTVVDCGAHAGFFTLLAAAVFPAAKLSVFEPNPLNIRALRRQIELNGLSVEVMEAAVSTKDGKRAFGAEHSNTGALLAAGAGQLEVRTVDFARWLAGLGSSALVLKMDIEGEEERVLPAALGALPEKVAVYVETHGGRAGWDAMSDRLRGAGMEPALVRNRGQFIDGFAVRNP